MITLNVPDMSCGHCKATVEKAITAVDASAKVAVDLSTRKVEVTSSVTSSTLLGALKAAGYPATAG